MTDQNNDAVSGIDLVVPELDGLMQTVFQDHLSMETTSLTIWNQAEVDLALVPTLPQTQALARADVQTYQNTISAGQMAIYEDVQSFNRLLQRFIPDLLPLAQAWDNGDQSAASKFKLGLQIIQRYANGYRHSAKSRQEALNNCLMLVNQDVVRYQTDVDQVNTKIKGAGGEVDTLTARLQSVSTQLDDANRRVAAGATKDILKAAELGLKLGMEVAEVPGVASVVVDVAFSYADEAVGDDHDALQLSQQLRDEYRDLLIKLASEQAQFGVLDTLKLNVDRFANSLTSAANTNASLIEAWKDMAKALGNLCDYQVPNGPGFFAGKLTQAQQFWQTMSDEAVNYENGAFAFNDIGGGNGN